MHYRHQKHDFLETEARKLTCLLYMLLLGEHLVLVARVKMLKSMSTRPTSSRHSRRSSTLHHSCHHRTSLGNLRSARSGDPSMHLLTHRHPRLLPASRYTLVRGMTLDHWMATVDNSSMPGHPGLVACKRLWHARHHGGDESDT